MSADQLPFVSVVVPSRNEKGFISGCLDSIIANDYPKDKMEIIAVDGMSEDSTREIIKAYEAKYSYIHALDNPKKILAAAWNIGINNSTGAVIMAMNAHASFNHNYISTCVRYLREYNADYAGGIIKTVPRNDGIPDSAIAAALSHPFGVGDSYFRTGTDKPRWADTAAFGGYRRDVFQRAGLYNEDLTRSQDMEFHLRLKKIGAKILLVPDMVCTYYTRADIRSFLRDSFVNGFWTVYPLQFSRIAVSLRHLVPLVFVVSLTGLFALSFVHSLFLGAFIVLGGLYMAVSLYFSASIALREKKLVYVVLMPVIFALLHFLYGFGTWFALCRVLAARKFWKRTICRKG
jgi:glycosyltransferase involved in cell wall biosynthesis